MFKMKKQKLFQIIAVLSAVLLLPTAAFAQSDLGIITNSLSLNVPVDEVRAGEIIEISAEVENKSEQEISAHIKLLINDEEFALQQIVVEANSNKEVKFEWTAPASAQEVDLSLRLSNQDPEDENDANDIISLFGVQVSSSGEEAAIGNEAMKPVDKQVNLVEDDIIPINAIGLPDALIHIEQINWNTFRFRPSFLLGEEAQSYHWQFGDGSKGTKRVVQHTYAKPGVYQVQLELFSEDGSRDIVDITLQVGFFHLSNWRLWVLILLLAAIIIIAAIVAGSSEKQGKPGQRKHKAKKKLRRSRSGEERSVNDLSDEKGMLDSLAEVGLGLSELSDELSFLEELRFPLHKTKTKKKMIETKKRTTAAKKKVKKAAPQLGAGLPPAEKKKITKRATKKATKTKTATKRRKTKK